MKYRRKKVLVCGPQSDIKDYCFDEWAENVKNFTYPEYDVFPRFSAVLVPRLRMRNAVDRYAGITGLHQHLLRSRPAATIRGALGSLIGKLIENGLGNIVHPRAIRRIEVKPRPTYALWPEVAVLVCLPAEESLHCVVCTRQHYCLATARSGLIIQTDDQKRSETAERQRHLRIHKERC